MKLTATLFATILSLSPALSLGAKLAIMDSGVDYKHRDLAPLTWTNPASKTVTADGTEYLNDKKGWNFGDDNNEVIDYRHLGTFSEDLPKVMEIQAKALTGDVTEEEIEFVNEKRKERGFLQELSRFANFIHGTHVSGVAAGDSKDARVIAIKLQTSGGLPQVLTHAFEGFPGFRLFPPGFFDEEEKPQPTEAEIKKLFSTLAKRQVSRLVKVGHYNAAVQADVANGSFGISVRAAAPIVGNILMKILEEPTQEDLAKYTLHFMRELIVNAQDFVEASPKTLYVFASGNDGTNNDRFPVSPANVARANTISVAATVGSHTLARFSNYGAETVDIAAPGVAVRSTVPGDEYLALSGTSMSAPYVTQVAGSVKDANPALGPVEIKKVLMGTVDKKDFLAGKVKSGGVVNRDRAIKAAQLSKQGALEAAIAQSHREVPAEEELWGPVPNQDAIVPIPMPTGLF